MLPDLNELDRIGCTVKVVESMRMEQEFDNQTACLVV